MKSKLLPHLSLFLLLLFGSSCADFTTINRSYLNHPAMNFEQRLTEGPTGAFTILSGGSGTQNAGCATCAK